MTAELTGRDLDRAVAVAMGYRFHNGPIGWCRPNGRRERWGRLFEFSTDHAALPEMLAWLHARPGRKIVDIVTVDGPFSVMFTAFEQWPVKASGATLPEALARLCVAIAAEQAKETKQ